MQAQNQETREPIEIGDEVVVFDYTNTVAKCSGKVIALTEHHVQLQLKWGRSDWFPLVSTSKVRRSTPN